MMEKPAEKLVNGELARILRTRNKARWTEKIVYAENTAVSSNEPGKTPDIIASAPPYHPICIETKTGSPRNVDGRRGKGWEKYSKMTGE